MLTVPEESLSSGYSLTDLAMLDFSKSISLNGSHAYPYLNRGYLYAALGDPERAIEDFDNAVRLCPNYEPEFIDMKLAADGEGIANAIELLQSVVGNPRRSEFDYYYTGIRCLLLNDLLSAEDCFRVARNLGTRYSAKIDEHLQNLKSKK